MRFDTTDLTHLEQIQFVETIKGCYIEDNYYRVFYDRRNKEFVLIKIDCVIKNKAE